MGSGTSRELGSKYMRYPQAYHFSPSERSRLFRCVAGIFASCIASISERTRASPHALASTFSIFLWKPHGAVSTGFHLWI